LRVDHSVLCGDIDAEVIEGILMESFAVIDEEDKIGVEAFADEGDVAMCPFFGSDTEQPSIKACGEGEIGDTDTGMEFVGEGALGDIAEGMEDSKAGLDLVTGDAEVLESFFVGEFFVFAVGILERPVEAFGAAEKDGADFFGAEGDDEIDALGVDLLDGFRGMCREIDSKLLHGFDGEGVDAGGFRASGLYANGIAKESAGATFGHLGASGIGDAKEEDALEGIG
jgi:hypothetical protein